MINFSYQNTERSVKKTKRPKSVKKYNNKGVTIHNPKGRELRKYMEKSYTDMKKLENQVDIALNIAKSTAKNTGKSDKKR